MKNSIDMGMNRTGIQMSPIQAKEMNDFDNPTGPLETTEIRMTDAEALRRDMMMKSGSIGTVPVPGTLKGAFSAGTSKLTGVNAEVLIDKLGERLAFERTGVRLYDALLSKYDADPVNHVSREELVRFRQEEANHFDLIKSAIESIGADPTAMTPSADVNGVAAMGLVQVLRDPRTSFLHALHAVHIAELTDNDGWEMLSSLFREAGMDEWADRFDTALSEEGQHLQSVRAWMKQMTSAEAKMQLQ